MEPARAYPTVSAPSLAVDPLLDEVRETEGVARLQLPHGGECWVVTRYDDVRAVYADARFCRRGTTDEAAPRTTSVVLVQPGTLNSMDGPEHVRLRRAVLREFTPRRVEGLRPRAQEITDALLDEIEAAGPPADLVEQLALPLPIAIVCELLGVPFADRDRFRAWTESFMSDALTSDRSLEEIGLAFEELLGYIADLVDRRRSSPEDDLLSALATGPLSGGEVVSLGLGLLVGGFETTAHMIGKSVLRLFDAPDALATLRARPELVPRAVEELLRHISLAGGTGLPFMAAAPAELSGASIEPGDFVLPAIGAANFDTDVFDDADALDVTRDPNPHLAFGHGAHFCLGAHLARMELQVAIGSLLRRFPDLRLAVDRQQVPWRVGSAVWGLQALPVEF